jgi:hypothetical protein
MFKYTKTTPRADELQLARLTLEIVSAQLRISEPRLHFIRESPAGEIVKDERIFGCAEKDAIFIRQGLPPRELIKTTAHECRHIAQFKRGYKSLLRERDCFAFEHEFTQDLNGLTADDLIVALICRKYS